MVGQTLNLYDAILVGHPFPALEHVDNLQGGATQELIRQS
jgi:hypothetical protein